MLDGETMQQEFEDEFENEFEFEDEYSNEFEDEYEGEEFLGSIAKGVGSLLGMGDGESEYEYEYESEAFLGRIKRLVPKLLPVLKKIAPLAAGAVGTAIGGPAAGAALGAITSKLARESESEYELTSEFESEYEWTSEISGEYDSPQYEALTEALATAASQVESEAEAEGYAGAFTARIIPLKSSAIRQVTPNLIRGSIHLTRVLRKSPTTRPLVKVIPSIVDRTSKTLVKQAAKGQSVTPKLAARVMAAHTQKVLSNPVGVAKTLVGSSQPKQKMKKPAQRKRNLAN